MFDFLKRMYDEGRIDNEYLRGQTAKERITPEQYEEVTGEAY